jgi:hypothetical protein
MKSEFIRVYLRVQVLCSSVTNPLATLTDVYIVVTPVQRERKTYYRVQVLSRDAVAPWGPQMPSTLFTASKYTRMFLLTKRTHCFATSSLIRHKFTVRWYFVVINAERTSQDVTIFRNRIVRTRRNMLLDIIQEAKTKHKATMMKKSKRSGLTKSTSKRKLDPKSLRGAFGIMDEKKSKDDSALPGSLSARGDKSSTPSPTLNLDVCQRCFCIGAWLCIHTNLCRNCRRTRAERENARRMTPLPRNARSQSLVICLALWTSKRSDTKVKETCGSWMIPSNAHPTRHLSPSAETQAMQRQDRSR